MSQPQAIPCTPPRKQHYYLAVVCMECGAHKRDVKVAAEKARRKNSENSVNPV
jgi:hypothetical protein